MYGHGYPQPAPPQRGVPASVIVLRVLFAVLPLLSIGFLTWGTALRIALLTRRVVDWVLFGLCVGVVIASLVLMPEDEKASRADWVVGMILLNAVAFTAYYLAVDIRLDRTRLAGAAAAPVPSPYNPYAATAPQQTPSYGYPQPQPQPQPPVRPQPVAEPRPQAVAPPQPPVASPRIDQVRAELDELSDLLRKDKDPREGGR
ncbi:hypothetical protein [Streptomyces sp. NPDC013740]|uniref:hypothetical protein n=1 Tax=Streptomyces sp. NPDC013740 TaxID=3364867 RepID=UPI0036F68736